jgi:hypothetical protein
MFTLFTDFTKEKVKNLSNIHVVTPVKQELKMCDAR